MEQETGRQGGWYTPVLVAIKMQEGGLHRLQSASSAFYILF